MDIPEDDRKFFDEALAKIGAHPEDAKRILGSVYKEGYKRGSINKSLEIEAQTAWAYLALPKADRKLIAKASERARRKLASA